MVAATPGRLVERFDELRRAGEPVGRQLLQCREHRRLDVLGDGPPMGVSRRILGEHPGDDGLRPGTGERRLAPSISYSTHPARRCPPVVSFSPMACSGAMYCGVPSDIPVSVMRLPPALLHASAMPKSATSGGRHAAGCLQAAIDGYLAQRLGVQKKLLPVRNTRGGISKKSMVLNDATPNIEVDAETYEVRADGELLTCEPANVLPMAQRYFLF